MSYIDSINHSYVGSFAGLPVYHPLEILDEAGTDEFTATPANLVIGGGGGEHPGMVVQNLDFCVLAYLETIVETSGICPKDSPFFSKWLNHIEQHASDKEYNQYSYWGNLLLAHWSMDQICAFTTRVNQAFNKGWQLLSDTPCNYSCEEKICVMIGEFVFHSAPHLLSPSFSTFIKNNQQLQLLLQEHIAFITPFQAIHTPQKGYPTQGGRYILNNTVKWGLRFDEEHTINLV